MWIGIIYATTLYFFTDCPISAYDSAGDQCLPNWPSNPGMPFNLLKYRYDFREIIENWNKVNDPRSIKNRH